jgi:two-component system response regulator (stage 0 sporulation protein A)
MRIVLAEDDRLVAQSLGDSLRAKDHDVIVASDGEAAINHLRASLPEVLILDMVLPRLDGLAVLAVLPSLRLERRPRVIALSPFHNDLIARRALELGALRVLPKPTELNGLHAAIQEKDCDRVDRDTRGRISRLLTETGIPLHTKGGTYLTEAISIASADYSAIEKMRTQIYRPIATKFNTRMENVERLIRHAIETACTKGSIDAMHRLFGQTVRRETGKPTNAEFIAILAENVRLDLDTQTNELS